MTRAAELRVRPYREADEQEVAALWRLVFPDAPASNVPEQDIARKLRVQRELFLVARLGATLIGTAMAGYDGHRGWVHLLAVHPAFRHRGVGTRLMEEVERGLAAAGCPKLNLQVRAGNEAVLEFYRRLGYGVEERVSLGKRLA